MHDSRRTRLVLSVFLIAALVLITVDYRDGDAGPLGPLDRFGSAVFGPVENVASDVFSPVGSVVDGVKGAPSANAKISALQKQNTELRAELSQAQLDKTASAQLSRLLQLAGRGGYRIVAANVVAASPGYESTVTLDVGSADGIKVNQTVLNGAGLVGRVTSVSSSSCTVLLAIDASSTVGVRMAGGNELGSVTGDGKGLAGPDTLQLTLLQANAHLTVGQQLVTFGSVGDTPFVPGVPIGTITRLEGSANSLTTTAVVRPFVDFASLGVVGVVVAKPKVNPRDSVLPPKPTATATAPAGKQTSSPATSSTPTTSAGT